MGMNLAAPSLQQSLIELLPSWSLRHLPLPVVKGSRSRPLDGANIQLLSFAAGWLLNKGLGRPIAGLGHARSQ